MIFQSSTHVNLSELLNSSNFIYEQIIELAGAKPNHVCLVDSETGQVFTYANLKGMIIALANWLHGKIEPGTNVGISALNSVEYIILIHALPMIGCAAVLMPFSSKRDEYVHYLKVAEARYAFADDSTIGELQGVVPILPTKIINMKEVRKIVHSRIELHNLDFSPVKNKLFAILFSSGTTGLPKPVMLNHRQIMINTKQMSYPSGLGIPEPNDCFLLCLPIHHAYPQIIIGYALLTGLRTVVMPKYTLPKMMEIIESFQVTHIHLVPPIVHALGTDPLVDQFNLTSLKSIVSAAAALSPTVRQLCLEKLKIHDLRQLHGMSEACALFIAPPNRWDISCVGSLLPGVLAKVDSRFDWKKTLTKVQITDLTTKSDLSVMQMGELCVKGPQITSGYYKQPENTKQLFDKDGWLRTGDVGYFDHTGLFHYDSRCKDIIKYKGTQISPLELENVLNKHEAVQDCAVFGIPDPIAGDLPAALLVLNPNQNKQEAVPDIQCFLNDKVAPFKQLRGGIYVVEQVPRSAVGKINRTNLVKLIKQTHSSKL